MTVTLVYSIIVFCATLIGSLVGIGGGVIIKPMFDLVGYDTVDVVNFLSACAVFSMSVSSTIKYTREKTKLNKKIVFYGAIGSIIGGVSGNYMFDAILKASGSPEIVKSIQGIILVVILVASIVYINLKNPKTYNIQNPFGIIAVGLFLGVTGSFLGIGGGPTNVALLVLFFSMTVKESAAYSVALILFTQASKLITIYAENQFVPYDLKILLFIIPCAVIGGILGAKINKKANEKVVKNVFSIVVAAVAVVNIYNAVSIFWA